MKVCVLSPRILERVENLNTGRSKVEMVWLEIVSNFENFQTRPYPLLSVQCLKFDMASPIRTTTNTHLISGLMAFREEGLCQNFCPFYIQMRLVFESGYYSKIDFLTLNFAATNRERLVFKSGG